MTENHSDASFFPPGSRSRIFSENAQLQQQKKSLSALYCNLLSYRSERQNLTNPAPIGATSVSDPAPVLCHSALIPLIPTVVNGVAVDSVPLSHYSNSCHCSGIVYIYDVIAHMLLSSVKKKFFDFLLFQAPSQKAELYCRASLALESRASNHNSSHSMGARVTDCRADACPGSKHPQPLKGPPSFCLMALIHTCPSLAPVCPVQTSCPLMRLRSGMGLVFSSDTSLCERFRG